ncbi:MAG TPA: minichromosome maintenance protein MCM, partial [Ferroplasma sp.]|nr:minichromosome maintenance protein MCM [Ferroplasma sp.]
GLTAAAVRDDFGEGRWTLEAGALVLADKGFVAIDELDKMDQRDTSAMHEAMEQQTVTIAKAGIMATLNSRCSILAAANPKFGRYDPMKTIAEQIDFPPPLLSRFDIIFKLVDTPDKERDRLLASHILKENMLGEEYHDSTIPEFEIEFVPAIDRDLIRKYVSYAKNNVFPKLSHEAVNILLNKYLESRVSSDGSVPITARQLESPIRLAEASARARLSNIIAKEDALLATSIIDYYLKDVSSMKGKVDIDILNTGISSSERHELEVVYETIKEIKANIGRFPDLQHVLDALQNKGINNGQAMSDLERLKAMGQIYEPTAKKIDVIK